jgi:hypothetical protein
MDCHRLLVVGRVHRNGEGLDGAIVHLVSFTAAGTPIRLVQRARGTRVNTVTENGGHFSIYVGVEGSASGSRGVHGGGSASVLGDLDQLAANVNVIEQVGPNTYAGRGHRVVIRVLVVVSLRAVSQGNIPDPREVSSFARDAVENYARLRGYVCRIPFAGITIIPPSGDWLELLGFRDISL